MFGARRIMVTIMPHVLESINEANEFLLDSRPLMPTVRYFQNFLRKNDMLKIVKGPLRKWEKEMS